MRRTDTVVHDKLRLMPLSVSADRIAHVALRCAVLLAKLDAAGRPVDRSGGGTVVEVYPAASLLGWAYGTAAISSSERPMRSPPSRVSPCGSPVAGLRAV